MMMLSFAALALIGAAQCVSSKDTAPALRGDHHFKVGYDFIANMNENELELHPDFEGYEAKSAKAKEQILFDIVKKNEGESGSYPTKEELSMFLCEDLHPTVEHFGDDLPYRKEHGKRIHSVGGVCTGRFEEINPSNPFTGLFLGAPHAMFRLSLAALPMNESSTPGIAVKLFRDGMHSANFLAMRSLEPQSSLNFFRSEFSNHLSQPDDDLLKLVGKNFARVDRTSTMVGLSDLATHDKHGQEVEGEVNFPWKLVLRPNPDLTDAFADVATEAQMKAAMESIPPETVLYEVLGLQSPESVELIPIGNLVTTSSIVYSKNGDEFLFFRHQRMVEDVDKRPEWKPFFEEEANQIAAELADITSPCPHGHSF